MDMALSSTSIGGNNKLVLKRYYSYRAEDELSDPEIEIVDFGLKSVRPFIFSKVKNMEATSAVMTTTVRR